MNKFYKIFALAAAAAAFASCNKVETVPSENKISIRVGTESKTILRNGTEVRWSSQDKIRVFDNENAGFKFETTQSDVAKATFTCTEEGGWTGGVPLVAIHSYRPTLDQTAFDGTKVTANITSNQVIYNNKSYARDGSLSIGVVSKEGGDYVIDEMKNCFSLIKFQLENNDITSVKLRGNNNETLAGWVKVSYNDGNPTWEVDGDNGEKEILITVSGSSACHNATKTFFSLDDINDNDAPVEGAYYIAVLPQTLAAGLTLEIEKLGGLTATRTIDAPITLNRAKIREFQAPIDHDLDFVKGNIVLDCTDASLFRHGDPATGLTARTSTIYADTVQEPFDFWLEGYEDYKFYGQVTNWSGNLSGVSASNGDPKIKLPTIDGYVLASVQITYSHSTSNRTYTVTDGTNTFASCTMKRGDAAVTLNLTNPAFTPASDDRYLAYSHELGAKFILTYMPEGSEPEEPTEIVINCNDASQFVDGDGNPLAARSASIYDTVTSAFDFWLNGKPEYVFNGQVSQWSKTLSAKSRTLVKLPKISGYVLKEVNITYSYSSSERTYIVTDGTADTELDPPYTQLGKVKRKKDTTGETKIDLTGVSASSDERYLTSPGEMCGQFILTYTKVLE
ncbi:MAG: hypothetical protein IJS62_09305 [Bacteroidales bacterium]|nr:hypothetical protein [Bacteroidales bacterium]